MLHFKKISFFVIVSFCLSCQIEGIYKSIEDFKEGRWYVKQVPAFTFEIKDETKSYNLYYYIRNSLSYPYYNLFLRQSMVNPEGKPLNLNKLKELTLFDPTSGKPYGDGLGDIFDHKILIIKAIKFPQKGKYTLKLGQDMRQDPLLGILSVGIGIEEDLPKK